MRLFEADTPRDLLRIALGTIAVILGLGAVISLVLYLVTRTGM